MTSLVTDALAFLILVLMIMIISSLWQSDRDSRLRVQIILGTGIIKFLILVLTVIIMMIIMISET